MYRFTLLIFSAFLAALVGCSHYRIGTTESGDLSGKVFIAPVSNESEAPQIRALLTDQLRRQFSNHPSWRLASSRSDADVQLEVAVVKYNQAIAAFNSDDTGRGDSYALTLAASLVLADNSGTILKEADVAARSVLFALPGQPETLYQAMPGLAQQLAEKIVREVTYR